MGWTSGHTRTVWYAVTIECPHCEVGVLKFGTDDGEETKSCPSCRHPVRLWEVMSSTSYYDEPDRD